MRKNEVGYEAREARRKDTSRDRRIRRESTAEKKRNEYKGRGALKCGICGRPTTVHPVATWCKKMKP